MFFKELFTRLCTGALSSTLVFCVNPACPEVQRTSVVKTSTLYAGQATSGATTNTVKKIKSKTQTGIEVSYRNTTLERYSHIDPKFVSVYPVYTIEYANGEIQKDQVDKKARISADDLDIDYGILFDKGENEFYVKQLSTGFEDTFTVLGAEIVKKEFNSLSAVYIGEGGLKVGDKVPRYDIDVVAEYKVTYDNGEIAYENDYAISGVDCKCVPEVLGKNGVNTITLYYTSDETNEKLSTTVNLNAKGEGNTSSGEKKNEEDKPEITESRSSIPVYVDARSHTFFVTVLDIFLDEQGNEIGRDVRENYKAEYGTQVEAYASDFDKYYLVSDAWYLITIKDDTEIKFFYQLGKPGDDVEDDQEKKPSDEVKDDKETKPGDDDDKKKPDEKKDKKKDTTPSGDNDNHDNNQGDGNPQDNTEQNDNSISSTDNTGADENNKTDRKKKDKISDKRKNTLGEDATDDDASSEDKSVVSYDKYGQDAEAETAEDKHVVSASKKAVTGADAVSNKADDDKERTYRKMATGLVSTIVGVGLLATGAFKYLWMLLLTLFTRKKRYKWHGIVSARRNRFAEVKDTSGSGLLYQDYIDKYKDLGTIFDELRKSGDYTLLPVNTKADIKYGDDCLTVIASEEEVFSVLNKLPKGIGTVTVNIHNDMAGFEMPLTFTL